MEAFRRLIQNKKKKDARSDGAVDLPGKDSNLSAIGVPAKGLKDASGPSISAPAADGIGPLILSDTCQGSDSGVDLVFVHGLRGSRIKTWSKGEVCWPRDLLPKDVDNVRILTWGYDSSVANVFSYASRESIFGHADTLLNDLARVRKDVVGRGQPKDCQQSRW